MRIWFTASITLTRQNSIHRSMSVLATELRHYGHSVTLLFPSDGRHRNPLLFSLRLALRLCLLFWRRPHWILARSSDGLLCALASRLLKMKTKVMLYSHGWEERVADFEHRLPASIITTHTSWQTRLFRTILLRLALKESDVCRCGTINETRWLQRRFPEARNKIVFLPTGVPVIDQPFWPPQVDFPPSFLMAGTFTWQENLEYGIELFRRFLESNRAARLFIVGCGAISEKKRQLLYPLGDAVFTVESETPEKMYRWYESCPFFLYPSRYAGERPGVILEAQSRGCIVFAADIPPVRECITAHRSGFILTGVNPAADVTLMSNVYGNRELTARIGMSAWNQASRHRIQRQGKRCARLLLTKMKHATR